MLRSVGLSLTFCYLGFTSPLSFAAASDPAPASGAAATPGGPPAERPAPPALAPNTVDPKAVEALLAMGRHLRSLQTFVVTGDSATEAVLDNGQNVTFLHRTVVQLRRPDRVRAEITGSAKPRGLVYNGKTFTLYDNNQRYYTVQSAPPTIDGLVQVLRDQYGIEMPLADLFYWGTDGDDTKRLTTATTLGLERVNGKLCRHYAFREQGLDWELWLQGNKQPLPCRLSITDVTQPSRPTFSVAYRWNLRPGLNAVTFTYRPAAGMREIGAMRVSPEPYKEAQ
ncbi:DUF2092 domain-containing protein [Bordetella sp. LUAb4]|uniref:DUF2092 domain-containing protein n=1 Tax=Bordetella sp. LUAb4 TaxID=2843195 RepID=UPI001E3E824F|nr:DUF2092 domain-containing protein [Bordetella sp. LUAb4]